MAGFQSAFRLNARRLETNRELPGQFRPLVFGYHILHVLKQILLPRLAEDHPIHRERTTERREPGGLATEWAGCLFEAGHTRWHFRLTALVGAPADNGLVFKNCHSVI